MTEEQIQYLSTDKQEQLEVEMKKIKEETIPKLAKRIDDARQMGDLSENAEYHSAREEMAWAQSRVKQIVYILDNSEIISDATDNKGTINVGSIIKIKSSTGEKEYTIVGAQEADPVAGKISNESPLGSAFVGKKKGDKVIVKLPAGEKEFKITSVK